MPFRRRLDELACATLLFASLLPAIAQGGEWHRDRALVCSDCHTMHNSKGGRPMRYDDRESPGVALLRGESATAVCMACHRGDRPTVKAPGVASPSNWDPPGGGFPSDLTDPAHHAHALGPTPLLPPSGDTEVVMSCVTCHEPHGNGAYRNLRTNPSGKVRASVPPVVSQTVTAVSGQGDPYTRANLRYVSGMSQWCMDCHNLITAEHSATADALVAAHPWDLPLFGSAKADYGAWSGPVPNRVPVQNAAGVAAPNEGDQVFCLSCHKAHGSPNEATLIYADGVTRSSTCQQCHNV